MSSKTNDVAERGEIERIYQKKSQLEHILLRPDTYIGSVEAVNELMWVFDSTKDCMVQKQISYVPGLYKIFDEILVNAADNKQRDEKMDCIKIDIDQENNTISVWNNGKGCPVVIHAEEKMYVPTMIFGHLLTSSNYDDSEQKVTGGRNGYGAKLCNIFSTKFIVETSSHEYKKQFKQTWGKNMSLVSEAKVKPASGEDYTKITFSPDLLKFKMDKLDDDIIGLMQRRAYDICASSRGVMVILNGKQLSVKNFKDYIDLYIKGEQNEDENVKVLYENAGECWEVAMTTSSLGFQQVSFVNSIATTKGGRHVDYVTDMIVKEIMEALKKKNKDGVQIKPFQVKAHMWIFLNCLIVNPTFDSQTKENMTLQTKNFGSKCMLSEKFINSVIKSGIVESVLSWAKFKAQKEMNKMSGKKKTKLKGIAKLEDANEAGTRNSLKCTLILTEGDSAKSLAVSGLGVIGRDYYGVFPLRGKLLNVREVTHKQLLENAEINNLLKILGLQYKVKYDTEAAMKTLRYGKVMIMTDQDQDGSHIKGLLINFIHCNWPDLLRQNFLEEFITPIVKAKNRNEILSFYSLPEFEEWKSNTPNHNSYSFKYYKGLGTSTSQEAKEYFTDMRRHRIRFRYDGQTDDDHILLAFSKNQIEGRKEWLTNFMEDCKRRKEMGLPKKYLYTKDTSTVTYTDFVNLELVLFSNADNIRSIPCLIDGLKPGQRKVLFTCFKRNDKKEIKVAQLAGSVAELSAYHHGEVSLCMTIVNLAQNFVGSNNINLLEPRGQFGTRLAGGKDSASPRYIFTKMSPLARLIFNPKDDPLLKYEYDDNQKIEPSWYIPIIPMILVNGADGIGTGWMTKIPNYNPREIVRNLRAMLDGQEPTTMLPWYKNFRGTIDNCYDNKIVTSGEISIIDTDKIEITELPIGEWTQNYKENVLEVLLHGNEKTKSIISDYKEYNTDSTVKFIVTIPNNEMNNIRKEGFHKVFKLQNSISTSSMCIFDELNCMRRMDTVQEILKQYYTVRLDMYQKRKVYLEGILEAEASKLTNQARFICEKCSGLIVVENKKRAVITQELINKLYLPDPVMEWRKGFDLQDERPKEEDKAKKGSTYNDAVFKALPGVKEFDYLLGMSMWMLTNERKNELLKQKDSKLAELEVLRKKTKEDLWKDDLEEFMVKLDQVEEKEREDDNKVVVKVEKKGRKKKEDETLPSTQGERVIPVVSEELMKKFQYAARVKEKRVVKKDPSGEDDEFSKMVVKKKRVSSKLNFPKISPSKADGKNNNMDDPDSGDFGESEESEVKFSVQSLPFVERPRRSVAKPMKYFLSNNEEKFSSDSDEFLHENKAVTLSSKKVQGMLVHIDSDDDDMGEKVLLKQRMSSDAMFNTLLGKSSPAKQSLPSVERPRRSVAKPLKYFLSDYEEKFSSDSDEVLHENKAVTGSSKKVEGMLVNIDSDDDDMDENVPLNQSLISDAMFDNLIGKSSPAKRKRVSKKLKKGSPPPKKADEKLGISSSSSSDDEVLSNKKKKAYSDSDDESNAMIKPKSRKKKADSDDDDLEVTAPRRRSGQKSANCTIDDSDSD